MLWWGRTFQTEGPAVSNKAGTVKNWIPPKIVVQQWFPPFLYPEVSNLSTLPAFR